jgi:DNA-3-methyladenine glycosylase II
VIGTAIPSSPPSAHQLALPCSPHAFTDDLTPAEARWENEGGAAEDDVAGGLRRGILAIDPVAPFRLDLTAWALRRRPLNAVDLWDGATYRRTLLAMDTPTGVCVTRSGSGDAPSVTVALGARRMDLRIEASVRASIERMLGLAVDLSAFYAMATADDPIGPLAARYRGLKPPRFPSVFESLVNAVACQQLSLEAGLSLLNRLAGAHGRAVLTGRTSPCSFPGPHELARLEPEALRPLGFSLRKAATIVDLSRAVVDGRLDLGSLEHLADDEVLSVLTRFHGIGRWSAEYVLLRGLGRLHIFPGDDVGARNNLARRLNLRPPIDYAAVAQATSRWQPYAGMAYFHLLLDHLEAAGALESRGPVRA